MHTQPAKAYAPCYNREHDEDVRPKATEVGVGSQHEEDDDLYGEGDAVAEQDNAVDRAIGAGEGKAGIVWTSDSDRMLRDEVLRGGGCEVEEGEAVVADVVGVLRSFVN